MRRTLFAFAVGAVFALPAPASAATATVEIRRAGFAPASVTVTQNDSVTWVNRDSVNHQVVGAVRDGHLYEIKSSIILSPGPAALTDGLTTLHALLSNWSPTK